MGKTATKGVIDGGSWLFGKLSKQVRLARPSDLFKNDFTKMVREFLLKICIANLKNLKLD